ncbi:CopY/TcrY family copper transport repressor [Streptococcus ratti]|uniref:Negative transcriptional regulator, CopY n=1 Tax=Streptococcus ratti FA-1 = DSM 20564 TaxID=699248 RepID=A0ABP2R1S7_STRRT|nr:CopY/TcrY family copper transport repressor [Streptococcus ratti]EJN95127.1 negative transcriptional regulator, CopY [Streptococcus ratti FA-1 = DSM 20564]EMP71600.1 negative transcriptional regulator, CopY [Streptococcus ratti FA-1 = DSM 20564]QEY07123.1 CopY/TcrY family copper transport repressor [Streptococcus ratti]VEI59547.1 negative transcriptional regulator, CopY [Streptococcus mutans]
MTTISNAEWEVMRVVWAKQKTSSSEIIAVLSRAYRWSASTIKTLITRLSEKGYVTSQRQGRKYIYSSLISEEEALEQQVSEVFSRICVTKNQALVKHLIEETPMTLSDIEDLEVLLLSKKANAVPEVKCNCIVGQCSCHEHLEVMSQ